MSLQRFRIADTSPSSASTAAGTVLVGLGDFSTLIIHSQLVGATGGTLDVWLQTSVDGGTTWFDFLHYTQLAAGGGAVKRVHVLTRSANLVAQGAEGITVGTGTSPALSGTAANTMGSWGDRIRALYIAGASTSAGAAVVIDITGYKQNQ